MLSSPEIKKVNSQKKVLKTDTEGFLAPDIVKNSGSISTAKTNKVSPDVLRDILKSFAKSFNGDVSGVNLSYISDTNETRKLSQSKNHLGNLHKFF